MIKLGNVEGFTIIIINLASLLILSLKLIAISIAINQLSYERGPKLLPGPDRLLSVTEFYVLVALNCHHDHLSWFLYIAIDNNLAF